MAFSAHGLNVTSDDKNYVRRPELRPTIKSYILRRPRLRGWLLASGPGLGAPCGRGIAESDKWIWTREEQVDGKRVRDRLTINEASPNSYSFIVEMQPADGGSRAVVAEGTRTRTQ